MTPCSVRASEHFLQLELDGLDGVALYCAHAREAHDNIDSSVDVGAAGWESPPVILTGGKGVLAPHDVAPNSRSAVRGITCHHHAKPPCPTVLCS